MWCRNAISYRTWVWWGISCTSGSSGKLGSTLGEAAAAAGTLWHMHGWACPVLPQYTSPTKLDLELWVSRETSTAAVHLPECTSWKLGPKKCWFHKCHTCLLISTNTFGNYSGSKPTCRSFTVVITAVIMLFVHYQCIIPSSSCGLPLAMMESCHSSGAVHELYS